MHAQSLRRSFYSAWFIIHYIHLLFVSNYFAIVRAIFRRLSQIRISFLYRRSAAIHKLHASAELDLFGVGHVYGYEYRLHRHLPPKLRVFRAGEVPPMKSQWMRIWLRRTTVLVQSSASSNRDSALLQAWTFVFHLQFINGSEVQKYGTLMTKGQISLYI